MPGFHLKTVVAIPAATAMVVALLSAAPFAQNSGQTAAAPNTAARPDGDAEKGKRLFKTIGCVQCHGTEGQGVFSSFAPFAGRRLAPAPMPYRRFVQFVRAPIEMPPYSEKVVPEQDLADIYAFLLSVPAPPDVDSIPLLAPSQFPGIGKSSK